MVCLLNTEPDFWKEEAGADSSSEDNNDEVMELPRIFLQ